MVALQLSKDSTYESKMVHLVEPIVHILTEHEEKVILGGDASVVAV